MIMQGEGYQVKKCLNDIEATLNWGSSLQWSNYDFEKLSGAIEEKTGVLLSVTTLKRIWGKIKYDHSPTITTLNTLAKFLGFEDWREYVHRAEEPTEKIEPYTIEETPVPPVTEKTTGPVKKNRAFRIAGLVSLCVALTIVILIFSYNKKPVPVEIDPTQYSFAANKVISAGVPNSVVFTYDASKSPTDSVYIIQTWDASRKTLVSKNNRVHSAIYYYPGYFRTRLIIGNTIVQKHDLQISTNGWLCLADDEPQPIYFKKEETEKGDRIEVDTNVLKKYNLSLHPEAPTVRFFNQKDMGNLSTDNFTFETTIKNEFSTGNNTCQYTQVLIQCKNDIIIVPLGNKACTGNMNLVACGKQLESKTADLTGFGADLTKWTTLRIECRDKLMTFYVNSVKATSFIFPNDPAGIVGVQYRFRGTGAVKNTWFQGRDGLQRVE